MAAIIKMSQNEWVKFFMQNGWIQGGRIQDGCHHHVESEWMSEVFFVQNSWLEECRIQDGWHPQVEWEWMSEVFICSKCLNPRWQNTRCLTSSSWVRVNEFQSDWISLSQSFVQNGWIQDRRIHDGSIIKLSQNEWVKFFLFKMAD